MGNECFITPHTSNSSLGYKTSRQIRQAASWVKHTGTKSSHNVNFSRILVTADDVVVLNTPRITQTKFITEGVVITLNLAEVHIRFSRSTEVKDVISIAHKNTLTIRTSNLITLTVIKSRL